MAVPSADILPFSPKQTRSRAPEPQARYTELQVTTNYSFLRGASHVEELLVTAKALGLQALAITDRNTLAGVLRAHGRAQELGIRLIVGCRLDLRDGTSLLAYPTDRPAYSRLCRLLTLGKSRAGKGACFLDWDDVAAHAEGLLAILLPGAQVQADLHRLHAAFGDRAYLALSLRRRPGDAVRLQQLADLAQAAGVATVATGDVLYHAPHRRVLQDVMSCIREGCTIEAAGHRLERFADRHLRAPDEMARLFAAHSAAIARTAEITARCSFSLGELRYQYPDEAELPGETAQQALERHVWASLPDRYPQGAPPEVYKQLHHELQLIGQLSYAPYFLTVNTIVRQARSMGILCQGRGSAANSAVCYVLGVTAINPVESNLLFERFVSAERREPPDIDVDFEHERREEIIQWIYDHYGRNRAALCATIVRYRSRGAVREVGKVMGLTEDVTAALASQVWGWSEAGVEEHHAQGLNLNLDDRRLRLTLDIARELIGHPRHMSQHPGGFVLTQDELADLVPIEPAAMENRQVIEWDKDDIDILKFMKVDILGLGMLGCLRRGFDMLEQHRGIRHDMATIPQADKPTYAMIQKADTLGTFQIESRAQMAMLPRHKPATLYDLTIQVAVVRPGPIQGDMVHPYLRRRAGLEQPEYPHPDLERVLGKTLGVPLFQEQAMQVAIVCAGFTPGEADQLRRAMATFKQTGGVSHFHDKMITGMVDRGYTAEFAARTFSQIEGFGSYGFPESHAASFALIAYASAWMKCHHPDVFCAALLNAQPMGFYAPAQVVRDAREHGVEVRPPLHQRQRLGQHAGAGGRPLSRGANGPAHGEGPGPIASRNHPGAPRRRLRLGRRRMAARRRAGGGTGTAGGGRRVWRNRCRPPPGAMGNPRPRRAAAASAGALRACRSRPSPRPSPKGRGSRRRKGRRKAKKPSPSGRGLGGTAKGSAGLFGPWNGSGGEGRHRGRPQNRHHPHRTPHNPPPHDRRSRGRGRLPDHGPIAAPPPRSLPTRRTTRPRHDHLRRPGRNQGRPPRHRARHRARPPEARQRQGRHVHHH